MSVEFVWRMEGVSELYEEPHGPKRPVVVCFDEMVYEIVAEKHVPIPARHGVSPTLRLRVRAQRVVRNLLMFFEPKASWRHVDLRERRTAVDFAHQMRKLADEHYPEAEKIRVVLDNLTTHTGAALYEAFEPQEARRILRCLEFDYTPKHASWLNQLTSSRLHPHATVLTRLLLSLDPEVLEEPPAQEPPEVALVPYQPLFELRLRGPQPCLLGSRLRR